jgi:glycosyltransferase involved in cell wall biosynthesis
MLEAARNGVEARGWRHEAVFSPGAERHAWYHELLERGVAARVAPPVSPRGAMAWTYALLSEQSIPTLVHTHFSAWDAPAALAALRRGDEAKVIWHLHSRLLDDWVARARNAARFGLLGRTVARILCAGPGIRAQAVARFAPADRTEVLLNGIDLRRFLPASAQDRPAARARLGLPPDGATLLMFAWDWELKGGPLLLETVQELRRRGRDVRAVIVGSVSRARAEAERRSLDGAVHAMRPVEAVRDLYGAADVFVAPSLAEGTPFSVLEVLASGTPVVASDIVGHRFAASGMPACRLTPLRASAFADAVGAELDADATDRAARLALTRERIERDFSLERWTHGLLGVYDEVLGTGA